MVNEAIKLITGIGRPLLGRVLVFDALAMSWRELRVRKDPDAAPITALGDYEAFCGLVPAADIAAQPADSAVVAGELARMLAARRAGGADFELIDVREPGESAIVSIPGARLLPQGRILSGEALPQLPRDKDIVVHCKSGARSAAVLAYLRQEGFSRARHLDGGILEWIRQVEPDKPVY
jgi:adenylyltransferase/sulfurtransferase